MPIKSREPIQRRSTARDMFGDGRATAGHCCMSTLSQKASGTSLSRSPGMGEVPAVGSS